MTASKKEHKPSLKRLEDEYIRLARTMVRYVDEGPCRTNGCLSTRVTKQMDKLIEKGNLIKKAQNGESEQ